MAKARKLPEPQLVATASNVVRSVPQIRGRRIVNQSRLPWVEAIGARLDTLVRLPINWDGYNAGPVSFQLASFAMNLLQSACPVHTSQPQLVPGPDGDIQIEWHSLEFDIELHVRGPFDVVAYRHCGSEIEEVTLSIDFTVVADWLEEMEEKIAARSAAA